MTDISDINATHEIIKSLISGSMNVYSFSLNSESSNDYTITAIRTLLVLTITRICLLIKRLYMICFVLASKPIDDMHMKADFLNICLSYKLYQLVDESNSILSVSN